MSSRGTVRLGCALTAAALVLTPTLAMAADAPTSAAPAMTMLNEGDTSVIANTVWTLIAGMLVFFMNAGFATLEAGLCRRKNAVNILAKNFIVFGISAIAFWIIGFGFMFGNGNSVVGTTGFLPDLMDTAAPAPAAAAEDATPAVKAATEAQIAKQGEYTYSSLNWAAVPISVKFFFQLVFAGTAATIVSGCVAERIKFGSFMIFSFLIVAFMYPVTGHWIWGGGWLSTKLFHDFAGSAVVHSVGGWAGLVGILLLGPRIGKYNSEGKVNPIPGHSMALASIGCLILWLGWFGFNPGSTMAAGVQIGHIAVTTNTAAAFGSLTAAVTAWLVLGKPDLSMILNGCLAGLVAITAPCAVVTVAGSAAIGAIAGVLAVLAVIFWDKLRVDDPVGALAVHLVNGTFGVICVGLFASPAVMKKYAMEAYCRPGLFYGGGFEQLGVQLLGIAAVAGFTIGASFIAWGVIKATLGIRVAAHEEIEGLDVGEHGMEAYSGFAGESFGTADLSAAAAAAAAPAGRTVHA